MQLGQGSDENWSRKLYSNFIERNTHPRFAKPRFSNTAFIVHHFADHVEYSALGFLQKNRDSIFEEQVLLLRDSKACLPHIVLLQSALRSGVRVFRCSLVGCLGSPRLLWCRVSCD